MKIRFEHFRRDEDGAVTVDWVVLVAGIIAFALGTLTLIAGGTADYSEDLGTFIADQSVGS